MGFSYLYNRSSRTSESNNVKFTIFVKEIIVEIRNIIHRIDIKPQEYEEILLLVLTDTHYCSIIAANGRGAAE